MKRLKPIRQTDSRDCGAACLAAVAEAYGYRVSLTKIRDLAATGRDGTSVAGMLAAAEAMGFLAKGVKGSPPALSSVPLPAIAHIKQPGGYYHFVVITAIHAKTMKYMDPADGRIMKTSRQSFCESWSGVLIILAPGPGFKPLNDRSATWQRLPELVRPYRNAIIQALVGAILFSILGLSTSLYVQKIVDFVMVNRNVNLLNLISVAMILLLLCRMLISWFKSLLMLKTGSQVDAGLINRYYRHLLNLPQGFYDTMRTGDILSRIGDAIKIRRMITEGLVDLVVGVLTILVTLTVMAFLSMRLCLLMISALPLFILIFWIHDRINKKLLRRIMEDGAALESQLVESIQSHKLIKESGLQQHFGRQTEEKFTRFLIHNYHAGISQLLAGHGAEFISAMITIILLWAGTMQVLQGILSAGELMSFYTLTGYLLGPVKGLTSINRVFRDAGIATDRLFQVLDREAEKNYNEGLQISRLDQPIRFEDVSFRYGSRPWLFRELNFQIAYGKMTAIVGRSGCGKSTVSSLLEGLYAPDSGRILIQGFDLAHMNKQEWRKKIAVVPQQIELYSGTLLDNIICHAQSCDTEDLMGLLERTGLHFLINQLPAGILTPLGENGHGLSGGERQRLAFARALFSRPELLILDEPTSALDPQTEEALRSLIRSLRKEGLTILIMAHQVQTIAEADHIVLMENGRVVAAGSHRELIQTSTKYSEYWVPQPPQ